MKKLISRTFGGFVNVFRSSSLSELDAKTDDEMYSDVTRDYAKPLRIGDEAAMDLRMGGVWQINVNTYRVHIHDKSVGTREDAPMAPFAAMGATPQQALARAQQLVSALDGARRL